MVGNEAMPCFLFDTEDLIIYNIMSKKMLSGFLFKGFCLNIYIKCDKIVME